MKAGFDRAAGNLPAKAKQARPRRAKSWIHVNIGEGEAKEIRALTECLGLEYRLFLEMAVRSCAHEYAQQIATQFKVMPWEITKISKARRREIGLAKRAMAEAVRCNGGGFPERN